MDRGLEAHVPVQEKDIIITQTGVDASLLHTFEDGQCMSIGKYGVEFIHTPGHSPGSSCLRVTTDIDEEQEVSDVLLITGDTVFPVSLHSWTYVPYFRVYYPNSKIKSFITDFFCNLHFIFVGKLRSS